MILIEIPIEGIAKKHEVVDFKMNAMVSMFGLVQPVSINI